MTAADSQRPPDTTPAARVGAAGAMAPASRLRLAGYLLLLNAGVVLIVGGATANHPGAHGFGSTMVSACIDAALGMSFLKRNDRYRAIAITRIVVGLVLVSASSAPNGDFVTPLVTLFGFGGLLLVLIGQPSRRRAIAGAVFSGLYLALELVGIALM